jgi:branched-chain amino acid transport system substrate-binding protein
MKVNRYIIMIALVVLSALAITACAAPATQAPAPTSAPAATSAPAPTTAPAPAAFTCTDKIGCVDIAPGDPVHIAYAFVTSGDNAGLGTDTKYGGELAVDDAGGKILGHDIKFDGQDSQCSADGGQAAGTKLASDNTILAVIGTNCSSAAFPMAPIITNAGMVMVSPSATNPDLTGSKHVAGFLRTCHNDSFQGAVAAQFVANQLKVKTAATIHDGSPYAQALQQVFADNFKQLGGTITNQEAVNVGDKDMKPVLTRIAANKPQLLYFPIFVAEGGAIAAQIRDVPGLEHTILMGADGIFTPDFLKAGGKNTVGMFWSSPNFSAFGSKYADMLARYKSKYNVTSVLGPFHAQSYDAMGMILAAIQKVAVQDADGTLHVGRQALRDALYATKDYPGLTGTLSCDQNGDCGAKIIAVYQLTSDQFSALTMPEKPIWNPGGPDYTPTGLP